MATYELVNPHDPYTFEAPDDDVATAAVTLLGGFYGWSVNDRMGGMLGFGGRDDQVQRLEETLNDRPQDVSAALRSVARGNEERTSTVDLLAGAAGLADRIDASLAAQADKP